MHVGLEFGLSENVYICNVVYTFKKCKALMSQSLSLNVQRKHSPITLYNNAVKLIVY